MSPRFLANALSWAAALALPAMAQDAKPAMGIMGMMPAASASMPMDCPMMKDGKAVSMPMGKDGHCADMKAKTAKPAKVVLVELGVV